MVSTNTGQASEGKEEEEVSATGQYALQTCTFSFVHLLLLIGSRSLCPSHAGKIVKHNWLLQTEAPVPQPQGGALTAAGEVSMEAEAPNPSKGAITEFVLACQLIGEVLHQKP